MSIPTPGSDHQTESLWPAAWLFAVPTMLVLGCGAVGDTELAAKIKQAVEQGDGAVLRMDQLTDFAWDRLHVFTPYTTREQVERELGVAWAGYDASGIERHDNFTLLLFISAGQVVRSVAFPLGDGDFSTLHRPQGYARAEAIFSVATLDGRKIIRVWKAG